MLDTIYVKKEHRGGNEEGIATQVYRALGEVAEQWGDGILRVWSASNYDKQRRFWDRVKNVIFESLTK